MSHGKTIIAVDCESDPFLFGRVPIPFIWGVWDGKTYTEFRAETPPDPDPETMMAAAKVNNARLVEFLRKRDVLAYAHNGGKFDWHFLTEHMQPDKPLLIIGGRLARFEIDSCEFRDSYSLMPISLDQYQKTKIDYTKFERAVRHFYMDEISEYLKSDCVNLYNMVTQFEGQYGRHLTQAGAAMKIWQQRSGRRAPRSGPMFYDTFKPYYYGGRVQCFEAGDFEVSAKSADMRSAYPTAMLEQHLIDTRITHYRNLPRPLEELGHYFFTVTCVARGSLPFRATDGSLYFPADDVRRTYHVTGWELNTAIRTGTVENVDIVKILGGEETISFADYVNYFWQQRKEAKAAGDKGRDTFCKIFLNGLYGKFASDPRNYHQYALYPIGSEARAIEEGKGFQPFKEWLLVSRKLAEKEIKFYNLATAASITGLVRSRLWETIRSSNRPFYCDTDSITAVDFAGIKIGNELGEWSYEGEYDRLVIAGKKMYAFHHTGKPMADSIEKSSPHRGNWKKATKGVTLSAQDLIRVAAGKPVTFKPMVPSFSVHSETPKFISRVVKMTSADITVVPRHLDPTFIKVEP